MATLETINKISDFIQKRGEVSMQQLKELKINNYALKDTLNYLKKEKKISFKKGIKKSKIRDREYGYKLIVWLNNGVEQNE